MRVEVYAPDPAARPLRLRAVVVITIQPVNEGRPTAVADGPYSATEDTQLSVGHPARGLVGNDTDPDNDVITARIESQATSGAVTIAPNGTFSYLPGPNLCGAGKFTYVASDGAVESAPAEAKINVNCVVDAPKAGDDRYPTAEDVELEVSAPGLQEVAWPWPGYWPASGRGGAFSWARSGTCPSTESRRKAVPMRGGRIRSDLEQLGRPAPARAAPPEQPVAGPVATQVGFNVACPTARQR